MQLKILYSDEKELNKVVKLLKPLQPKLKRTDQAGKYKRAYLKIFSCKDK